jgi:UDP-3-O-[3-hydroxymyristoyl] glucosamine N-acyltransferase LpxD
MPEARRFAQALGIEADLGDIAVDGVSPFHNLRPGTLSFSKAWNDDVAATVAAHPDTLFLVPADAAPVSTRNCIPVVNPRLAYAQVVTRLLDQRPAAGVAATAVIEPGAQLGKDVTIGHYVVVEAGAVVGDRCVIEAHCYLRHGTVLGDDCRLGSHVSIGGAGFGYEPDADGVPVHIPHLAGVVIGDHVEIGSHSAVARGTSDPTRIEDHVKIDQHVFIAHNVRVGTRSIVIAGAEVSGSVDIGTDVWISPEVTIINKVKIGDRALVGIGAVVTKDVPANAIVAGVPAKYVRDRFPDA